MSIFRDSGDWVLGKKASLDVRSEFAVTEGFIRQALKLFLKKDILKEKGRKLKESYKWNNPNEDHLREVMEKAYGEMEGTVPKAVKDYYLEYGFDSLVEDVSRWIDHDGRVIKEYSLDRLLLGRYVDFLDKARQYMSWFKADQAIAKKKIADLKNKKNK